MRSGIALSSSSTIAGMLQPVQVRGVVVWTTLEYIGLLLFVLVVPRLMGPALYGSFAVLLAVIGVLTLITGLGVQAVFARYVPEYERRGDRVRTRGVFVQMLLARSVVAIVLGVAFISFVPRLIEGVTTTALFLGVGAFLLRAVGLTSFHLFYGLNSLGRWMTHDALSRILVLAVLTLAGGFANIERAALSLFLAEVILAALGAYWARTFFTISPGTFTASTMREHLRFGMVFFGASLFIMLAWRGGEIMLAVFTRESTEVAYFNIANAAVLSLAGLVGKLARILTPSVTSLYLAGRLGQMERWLAYSLKYLTILAFGLIFMTFVFGHWAVPMLLGKEYVAVLPNLEILVLALVPVAFIMSGMSLAVARSQLRAALTATAAGFLVYLAVTAILIPALGSVGASLAVVLSLVVTSTLTCFRFSMFSLLVTARYWRIFMGGGLIVGSLWVLDGRWLPLGLALSIAFVPFLLLSGVLTRGEYKKLMGFLGIPLFSAHTETKD